MPPDIKSCIPSPLPPNKYLGSKNGAAYDRCLDLEKRAEWSDPSQRVHAMPPCLAARVLGYALIFAPCDSGRNTLTWDVLACHNDLALKNLADMYIDGLIRAFRNPIEFHTPVISSDESPLFSEQAVKNMTYLLEKPTINFQELKTLVMSRDEYHCAFTGALDYAYYKRVRRDLTSLPKATETLQLAHIIRQSMSDNIEDGSEAAGEKANWVSPEGALLERFAGFSLRDILGNENNIESPLNAFMASAQVHNMFDSLELWLVPVQDKDEQLLPNTYDVKSTVAPEDFPIIGHGLKSQITFKTCQVGAKAIPPPDPRLLAVHAACAQIANMSGAAEYLDELFQDTGEISVLTQPGAVYELTRALKRGQSLS